MKVGELISELQKFDSEAEVGGGFSKLSGWAQEIDDVLMSEEGIVFINMGRETIGENELTLASTKVNLSKIASRIAAGGMTAIIFYDGKTASHSIALVQGTPTDEQIEALAEQLGASVPEMQPDFDSDDNQLFFVEVGVSSIDSPNFVKVY